MKTTQKKSLRISSHPLLLAGAIAGLIALSACQPIRDPAVIAAEQTAIASGTAVPAAAGTPEAGALTGVGEPTVTISTRSLRVRALPSDDAEVVAAVTQGDTFPVTGISSDGEWIQVEIEEGPDGLGWVSAEFVTLTGDITDIEVVDIEATAAATEEATEEPSEEASDGSAELVGPLWQWVETVYGDESVLTPSDPSRYTLTFNGDGTVFAQLDCNTGRGAYEVDGPTITFGPMASTLMACPEDSQADQFAVDLSNVNSHVFQDGHLFLAIKLDSGIMEFAPAEATEEATPEATEEATPEPTAEATEEATEEATAEPTEEATPEPTAAATEEATPEATAEPTEEATPEATEEATPEPTAEATEEATPEATEEATEDLGTVTIVVDLPLRVRSEPTTEVDNKIGSVYNLEVYNVLEVSEDGLWVRIETPQFPEGSGWVSAEFVVFNEAE